METNPVNSQNSPYAYRLPGRTVAGNMVRMILFSGFLASFSGILIKLNYPKLQQKTAVDATFIIIAIIIATCCVFLFIYIFQTGLRTWRLRNYSVTVGTFGLLVEGSHPSSGKLISWLEIEKIKKTSNVNGLELTTYGNLDKIIIPCELEGFPRLIAFITQQIQEKQVNRIYPKVFIRKYRNIIPACAIIITVITPILVYRNYLHTHDIRNFAAIILIGLYWYMEATFIQKITLTNDGVTLSKRCRSNYHAYAAIKNIQLKPLYARDKMLFTVVFTTDTHKPAPLVMIGFDTINVYLALHQAWQKAHTHGIP